MSAEVAGAQPAAEPIRLNTAHARVLLAKRYPPGEWALLQEIAPSTGGGTRYADAVALNLWKSRGYALHGFEIKVSRGDWLRELKQPEKAEDVFGYCDYWWVLAPKGVVKDGELPDTWGLLELREHNIGEIKAAPKLTPRPLTREFAASMFRRAHEHLDGLARIKANAAVADAQRQANQHAERQANLDSEALTSLRKLIADFEQETGISIRNYDGPAKTYIELARGLTRLGRWNRDLNSQLMHLAEPLEEAATKVREAAARFEASLKPEQEHGL